MKWKKMTDEEFRGYVRFLSEKVRGVLSEKGLRVDYVCPVLRSGAVPATYIANCLNIVKMAPLQIKIVKGEDESRVLVTPLPVAEITKTHPVILLVDATYGCGATARKAIETIRKQFEGAEIVFACIAYKKSSERPAGVVDFVYAYAIGDDELPLYPWEVLEVEQEHPDDLLENIYF